jgi:hypothetical protein
LFGIHANGQHCILHGVGGVFGLNLIDNIFKLDCKFFEIVRGSCQVKIRVRSSLA